MLEVNLDAMRRAVESLDYRPLFVTVSGAHLYGFPSADSDVDLRGCHLLPLRDVVGLSIPPLTREHKTVVDGPRSNWSAMKRSSTFNSYCEITVTSLNRSTRRSLCRARGFSTNFGRLPAAASRRNHYHHYRGFIATQRKLIAKEEPKRAKPVLYAYRVLMTGIHLLRTGEVEANLLKLNECFRLDFLEDLVARKVRGENISVGAIDWPFHEARLDELEAEMERAYRESTLPEDRDRGPINELLVRLRLEGERLPL